ncbi:acyl-CoA N-acyltransferase [Chytriomyces sp. MP71]|nr:acyl-CoA N-acyltransferase [Chytriomyces sp. MP71]
MAPLRAFADRTFPVRYDAPFFERALLARGLSLLLLDTRGAVGPPRVVAALLARKEPVTAHGVYDVYLAVLGVDAGLRRRGVASMLLRRLVDKCEAEADGWMRGFVLHVHVGNEGARRLYEANGFRVVGTIVGYYRDNAKVAEPRDAYYLRRDKGAFEIA